jgi:hypothetical protein
MIFDAEPAYRCSLAMAKKTRSSTATERVKSVAAFAPAIAMRLALPLKTGPAGFAADAVPSPG